MDTTTPLTASRKWIYLLGLTCVSLVITFSALEIFSRLFLKNITPPLVPNLEVGQLYRPHFKSFRYISESNRKIHLSTNAYGYRDTEWDFATTAQKIMVIGDSFTDATQIEVEERYSDVLGRLFDASGKPTEIYNFGKSGSGPETYYLVLAKWFEIIKPDVVIVSLFNGNDFENANYAITPASGRINYDFKDGKVLRHADTASFGEKTKWNLRYILGQSYVFQLLNDFSIKIRYAGSATSTPSTIKPLYCDPQRLQTKESYAIVQKLIKEMYAIAGDKLVLLQIPDRDQRAGICGADALFPEQEILRTSQHLSIPILQSTYLFGTTTSPYYYPGHLNPKGHEVVAKKIFELLNQLRK